MSYILDALKKSERERQRGTIATLQTAPQPVLSHRSLWIGILIGAGTLSAVGAVAWLLNLQPVQPAAHRPAASPAPAPPPESGVSTARPRLTESSASAPAAAQRTSSAAARRVASISQLDPADRARIQSLSLNVVSYSDVPAHRFIMVNQRIVHESETIGGGIVVKRILPEGALLGVGKYEIMLRPD